ncbi:MAG TPA: cytochrome c oxidase assembly protein [Acidimicrobiales bacterium]|nr:cytochrome c oxidase assembly protein [Acidimicrobiales bacterium]
MLAAGAPDLWRFQPHPEVWVLVLSLAALYVGAVRVVGPKAVPEGTPVLSRRNKAAAVAGIVLLWVASDWPMHDIAEEYLYLVHMVQHTILTLVVPPLALLATPRWLADLVLGSGRVRRVIQVAAKPVVAGVAFNAMTMAVHWPTLVNASVSNGVLHYGLHVALVFTAFMMWTPVCGPIEEWRMSPPAQMIYLFLMSVVPTVPGGWLTFAEGAVYDSYDIPQRAFGLSVQDDQQAAGVFMKLAAGGELWVIITAMFFVWAFRHMRAEEELARADRAPATPDGPAARADGDEPLTYDEVERAFAETAAAPEPDRPRRR